VQRQPVAFLSYARADDGRGDITTFRDQLAEAVSVATGTSFDIFQDRNHIGWGQQWQERINESLDAVTFLIPILTPSFFQSEHCRDEVRRFLERERQLRRTDLILPVYWVEHPPLHDEQRRRSDDLLAVIATHQHVDWRQLRYEAVSSATVRRALDRMAAQIRDALGRVQASRPEASDAATTAASIAAVQATPSVAVLRMPQHRYLDFELLIAKAGARYRAQVVESPAAGDAATEFRLPFARQRLENLLLRLGRPRVGVLGVDSPQLGAAREFGGGLFGAAFGGEVLACLRASLERAERDGAGLRIRLRLAGAPDLADLPWEFLYDGASGHFLALDAETPIVRYLDLAQPVNRLAVAPPLRVLAVIAGPPEWEPVDAEREWATLQGAFAELERGGRAVLERLERPTMDALQRRLQGGEVHVFHFVGHGGFRDQKGEGVLVFEHEQRGGALVTAEELGTLLRNHRSLRLAVLNACEGAKSDPRDPFGGTAQKLVQQGLPAVIAMQFPISMVAAAKLAGTFYDALAAG
jgi:hypothetical protein